MSLVIVGCGGLAAEVARSIVDSLQRNGEGWYWTMDALEFWSERPVDAAPNGKPLRLPTRDDDAIVAIGDNAARKRLMSELKPERWTIAIDHTTIQRQERNAVDWGTYVAGLCILAPRSKVGRGCIVNHGSVIGHDVTLEDFAQTGPLANLGGGVLLDEGAFVGASAVVLPGKTIGAWATVGAGAVVTKDIPPGETWAGNPARKL